MKSGYKLRVNVKNAQGSRARERARPAPHCAFATSASTTLVTPAPRPLRRRAGAALLVPSARSSAPSSSTWLYAKATGAGGVMSVTSSYVLMAIGRATARAALVARVTTAGQGSRGRIARFVSRRYGRRTSTTRSTRDAMRARRRCLQRRSCLRWDLCYLPSLGAQEVALD